jgi:hypothetical protein
MDTPRTAYKVSASSPGSDVAAETAAALASASIVFKTTDSVYSNKLLIAAKQVNVNKVRSKSKYMHKLWTLWKYIYVVLDTWPTIEMGKTNFRCELRLLL